MTLSRPEWRLLEKALRLPALWAFAVILARAGLDGALEHARARTIPAELENDFARAGWTAAKVPPAADLERLILGLRVHVRVHRPKGRRSVQAAADALGIPFNEAARALAAFDLWCGPAVRSRKKIV